MWDENNKLMPMHGDKLLAFDAVIVDCGQCTKCQSRIDCIELLSTYDNNVSEYFIITFHYPFQTSARFMLKQASTVFKLP